MTYLFIFLITLLVYYSLEFMNQNRWVLLSFLASLWILVLGSQYEVGTDYYSYINIYESGYILSYYKKRHEFAFYYIVSFLHLFKSPQLLFFVFSTIQTVFTFLIFEKFRSLNFNKLYFLVICYFSISGLFFNQTNGIRSFTAIIIFNYAIFFIVERKFLLWIFYLFLAGSFHRSAFFLAPLYFLYHFLAKKRNFSILLIFIFFPLFSGFLLNFYVSILTKIVPTMYSGYLDSVFIKPKSYQSQIAKLFYLPVYIYSALKLNRKKYSAKQMFLLNLGFLSTSMYGFSFAIGIVHRFTQFFDLLKIIPIYLLLVDLDKKKKMYQFIIVLLLLIFPFLLKITFFAVGEYNYDSILYQFYE